MMRGIKRHGRLGGMAVILGFALGASGIHALTYS